MIYFFLLSYFFLLTFTWSGPKYDEKAENTADTTCMHQYSICINKQIFCYCAICIFHSTLVSKWEKNAVKNNSTTLNLFLFYSFIRPQDQGCCYHCFKCFQKNISLILGFRDNIIHTFHGFFRCFFSVHCTRLVALLTIYLLAAYILGNFQLLYWPRPLAVLYPRARLRRGWRTPGRRREARLMLR